MGNGKPGVSAYGMDWKYDCDRLFWPDNPDSSGSYVSNDAIYQELVQPLVVDVLGRFSASIICCGQVAAGKTRVMFGTEKKTDVGAPDPGIVQRLIMELIEKSQPLQPRVQAEISVYELQTQSEKLRNLLDPTQDNIRVREPVTGVFRPEIIPMQVGSAQEAISLLNKGLQNRTTRQLTKQNYHSNLSHTIVSLTLRSVDTREEWGTVQMCDLAGWQILSKEASLNPNDAKTAGNTNKSLSALKDCVDALSRGDNRVDVLWRRHQLTRLLKQSLAGNSRTVVVTCISPSSEDVADCKNALEFCKSAAKIRTRLTQNPVGKQRPPPSKQESARAGPRGAAAKSSRGDGPPPNPDLDIASMFPVVYGVQLLSDALNAKDQEWQTMIEVTVEKSTLHLEGQIAKNREMDRRDIADQVKDRVKEATAELNSFKDGLKEDIQKVQGAQDAKIDRITLETIETAKNNMRAQIDASVKLELEVAMRLMKDELIKVIEVKCKEMQQDLTRENKEQIDASMSDASRSLTNQFEGLSDSLKKAQSTAEKNMGEAIDRRFQSAYSELMSNNNKQIGLKFEEAEKSLDLKLDAGLSKLSVSMNNEVKELGSSLEKSMDKKHGMVERTLTNKLEDSLHATSKTLKGELDQLVEQMDKKHEQVASHRFTMQTSEMSSTINDRFSAITQSQMDFQSSMQMHEKGAIEAMEQRHGDLLQEVKTLQDELRKKQDEANQLLLDKQRVLEDSSKKRHDAALQQLSAGAEKLHSEIQELMRSLAAENARKQQEMLESNNSQIELKVAKVHEALQQESSKLSSEIRDRYDEVTKNAQARSEEVHRELAVRLEHTINETRLAQDEWQKRLLVSTNSKLGETLSQVQQQMIDDLNDRTVLLNEEIERRLEQAGEDARNEFGTLKQDFLKEYEAFRGQFKQDYSELLERNSKDFDALRSTVDQRLQSGQEANYAKLKGDAREMAEENKKEMKNDVQQLGSSLSESMKAKFSTLDSDFASKQHELEQTAFKQYQELDEKLTRKSSNMEEQVGINHKMLEDRLAAEQARQWQEIEKKMARKVESMQDLVNGELSTKFSGFEKAFDDRVAADVARLTGEFRDDLEKSLRDELQDHDLKLKMMMNDRGACRACGFG